MEEMDSSLHVTDTTSESSSDVCPTEDAIRALLENLVDPLLPPKPSPSDFPSKSLRESVAKQVYAVVLLYNYYHRREHPNLECLSFESFRSLATVMRPALLQHLKESSEIEVANDSGQALLLEKAIVDACSLSMSLYASSDISYLKNWPVNKVAVLLVDSTNKSCYLQHSSITQGVWSLLEKAIEKEKTPALDKNEEALFQKLAFAAIEEATGVKHNDIVILERHLVYSLSEEKTSARFYIMKCTSQEKFSAEIPVEEALDCMQGPLFEKNFTEWSTKTIVEYFHVLPYASLIAAWFSRREDTEIVIEKEAGVVCDDVESNGVLDAEVSDIPGSRDNTSLKRRIDAKALARKYAASSSNPRPKKKPALRIQTRYSKGRTNIAKESLFASKAKNATDDMSHCNERSYMNGEKGGLEVESDTDDHRERGVQTRKKVADRLDSILKHNTASGSTHNSNQNLEELQTTLLSKATSLSETAMKVLLCKRDKLTLEQRRIEDEIAKCDKCIKNIKGLYLPFLPQLCSYMNLSVFLCVCVIDDCVLQLETILECCNEAYPRRILEESSDKSDSLSNTRMKLCESLPPMKSSCKKLDNICLEKNWGLPDYRVSPSEGGFKAEVRIKETYLATTESGEEKSSPEEARESAAVCLLSRLYHNITVRLA
ncbi:unnamed protein product [Cochlearia groenlandica]